MNELSFASGSPALPEKSQVLAGSHAMEGELVSGAEVRCGVPSAGSEDARELPLEVSLVKRVHFKVCADLLGETDGLVQTGIGDFSSSFGLGEDCDGFHVPQARYHNPVSGATIPWVAGRWLTRPVV
jgi:hypothetical protein